MKAFQQNGVASLTRYEDIGDRCRSAPVPDLPFGEDYVAYEGIRAMGAIFAKLEVTEREIFEQADKFNAQYIAPAGNLKFSRSNQTSSSSSKKRLYLRLPSPNGCAGR